ncbi:MAG: hypothetical protein EP318_04365 [Rhodobacteraceae bacterium]|nr:MAG: hypothetical protein EP318_04365 [Paracoccaceae bacterium]
MTPPQEDEIGKMTIDFHDTATQRRARIALMGEFSAGKSTLANLLLGRESSPVQVTATQLPPVWYKLGPDRAQRITETGARDPLPMDDWSAADPGNTQLIKVRLQADFLHACDLIDMPGTSDPCMVPDFWTHMLPLVDLVIWCTPASQAWRQSEAALWDQVPEELWARSLLLITRIDKLQGARDRSRVLQRVRGEAGAQFGAVLPIALPAAIAGRDDEAVLESSGAADMVRFLESTLDGLDLPPRPDFSPGVALSPDTGPAAEPCAARPPSPAGQGKVIPRRIIRRAGAASAAAG